MVWHSKLTAIDWSHIGEATCAEFITNSAYRLHRFHGPNQFSFGYISEHFWISVLLLLSLFLVLFFLFLGFDSGWLNFLNTRSFYFNSFSFLFFFIFDVGCLFVLLFFPSPLSFFRFYFIWYYWLLLPCVCIVDLAGWVMDKAKREELWEEEKTRH